MDCVISPIRNVQNRKVHRNRKVHGCQGLGLEHWGMGGNCSWVQFLGEMEISGSGCTTVSILKTNEFH